MGAFLVALERVVDSRILGTNMKEVVILTLLLLAYAWAEDDGALKACGDATKKLYVEICKKCNDTADVIRQMKEECLKLPPEIDANVVKIMKECDKENNPCDQKAMATCGENYMPRAEKQYQDNRVKDGKEPKTLFELFMKKKPEVTKLCEAAKKCLEEKKAKM